MTILNRNFIIKMKVMAFAPVVIPTLNRYEHLRNCVASLARCEYSSETVLFISVDYPPSEKYREGYVKIKEYLEKGISGFKDVVVIYQDHNLGAVKNCEFLKDLVFKSYDRLILTEDDNIFSPCFLDFMNQGMNKFYDDDRVLTICGYNHIDFIKKSSKNTIAIPGGCCWGIGLMKGKEEIIKKYKSSGFCKEVLNSTKMSLKLFMTEPSIVENLITMQKKGQLYGDLMRDVACIFMHKYQIRPSVSLCRNMGQDGSGVHSTKLSNNIYLKQEISMDLKYPQIDVDWNFERNNKELIRKFRLPESYFRRNIQLLKIIIKYFIYRLNRNKI